MKKNFFERYFYFIFVFVTGAIIMMIEMVAFRLATVYFGSSLFVWANIIGLIMISLSVGYYLGGKFADRFPQKRNLMLIVLLAGFLLGLVPLANNLVNPYFLEKFAFGQSIIISSFLFIAFLFSFPVALLGIVSPFIIRLQNREVATTGSTSGSVYAFSTIGSIFGTFFSSFFTIPLLGSKETILISAFSLILISLIGLKEEKSKVFFPILILLIFFNFFPVQNRENLVYEKESFYGLIQVVKDEKLGYILDINRSGRWSVYRADKILTGMYFDYFSPLYYLLEKNSSGKNQNLDILIIGHAGGVISRQYSYFFSKKFPGSLNSFQTLPLLNIDGVELDPEVTKTAYRFFNLKEQKGLKVINEDGRTYLQKTKKKYDFIFVDAYTSALYIPYQLASKEFFELTYSRLKDKGIFVMMVLAKNPEKERVFSCLSQTINSIYPYFYYFPSESRREFFIIASKLSLKEKLLNLEKRTKLKKLKKISQDIANNFRETLRFSKNCIFTDNWAPIELLTELDRIFKI